MTVCGGLRWLADGAGGWRYRWLLLANLVCIDCNEMRRLTSVVAVAVVGVVSVWVWVCTDSGMCTLGRTYWRGGVGIIDGGGFELIVPCDNEWEYPNGVRCTEVKCQGI